MEQTLAIQAWSAFLAKLAPADRVRYDKSECQAAFFAGMEVGE